MFLNKISFKNEFCTKKLLNMDDYTYLYTEILIFTIFSVALAAILNFEKASKGTFGDSLVLDSGHPPATFLKISAF